MPDLTRPPRRCIDALARPVLVRATLHALGHVLVRNAVGMCAEGRAESRKPRRGGRRDGAESEGDGARLPQCLPLLRADVAALDAVVRVAGRRVGAKGGGRGDDARHGGSIPPNAPNEGRPGELCAPLASEVTELLRARPVEKKAPRTPGKASTERARSIGSGEALCPPRDRVRRAASNALEERTDEMAWALRALRKPWIEFARARVVLPRRGERSLRDEPAERNDAADVAERNEVLRLEVVSATQVKKSR
eukprot:5430800-Pleurochrysis_carterae.AAC.4